MEGELWLSRVGDVPSGTTLFSEGPMGGEVWHSFFGGSEEHTSGLNILTPCGQVVRVASVT